jgi:hypothetical protein
LLSATVEEQLMYISVADSEEIGDNWTVTYSSTTCYHPDCSLCYSEVVESEESFIVIPGLSLHDEEVLEANQRFQARRRRVGICM